MRHDEAMKRLHDYLDDELGADERRAVAEHLDACADCARELSALRGLLTAARQLPRERQAPPELWAAVSARLDDRGPSRRNSLRDRPRLTALAAAAAVLLLLALGYATQALWRGERPVSPATPEAFAAGDSRLGPTLGYLQAECRHASDDFSAFALAKGEGAAAPTLALLTANLKIVDLAIDEIRQALNASPGNRHLEARLLAAYRWKVRLQQQSTRLIAGI